ncbi:ABC transporter ATP-binding protein [Massilibacteroides sp.]|uniref:ABC transporter ATP-binding protein n=1 Tax=Massilibacteroides sp. TaxID=2034766 RepID=UPI00260F407F|nr:ABC transporter ATP-binding protein [Massilibacteroides sp.]MDD4516075.1 ABC transporter ATP-binding protein [Massilibacteroides sp.]
MNSVQISHITKSYGNVTAVRDISLSINSGELFALIGPDGAGKTTLFRMLTTLLLPDKGDATVCGLDMRKDWRQIRTISGYMPGRFSLYQDLSVEENLEFFATVFKTTIQENYDLIHDIYVQLEPFSKRRAGKLSGGMKQKLALCCALIHRPRVLFLDEPTTGVDPVSRKEFWDILSRIKEQNITIIVSTPYMDEASRCDRIALMRNGSCLRTDTPEQICASFPHKLWSLKGKELYQLLLDAREYPQTYSCHAFGDCHHFIFKEENDKADDLAAYLRMKGHEDVLIERLEPSVEDCFMDFGEDDQ